MPSALNFLNKLADTSTKLSAFTKLNPAQNLINNVCKLWEEIESKKAKLETLHNQTKQEKDLLPKAKSYAQTVLPAMEDLRSSADSLETLLGKEFQPYPSYEDLLFSVQ